MCYKGVRNGNESIASTQKPQLSPGISSEIRAAVPGLVSNSADNWPARRTLHNRPSWAPRAK